MDQSRLALLAVAALFALGTVARAAVWGYVSVDIPVYQVPWLNHLAEHGPRGLATIDSNYNPPYLYLLLVGSPLKAWAAPVSVVKAISVVVDVVLAAGAGAVAWQRTRARTTAALACASVFALPTVVLNSAALGQCDATYAVFILCAVWAGESLRPRLALAGFASSLAFKLQATFLGPAVVLELVLARRRVAALLAGVVTYVIWLLPAALAGRPIQDLLTVYVRQMAEQPYLARNAANPWALWEIADPRYSRRTYAIATLVGVAVSAVVALMLVRILTRSIAQGRSRRLESYCAIALIVPFLLPKMHERYFFVADVLALTLACCDRRWIALAALVQLGSLGGYITYFFAFERWVPGVYPTVLAIGVVANIFALRLLGHWLRDQSRGRSPEIA